MHGVSDRTEKTTRFQRLGEIIFGKNTFYRFGVRI